MPSTVLVGAQWGDEGKGKITDLIASDYDYVVRFQGGNNAGHTVIHGDKKLALHLMPSGVMYENAVPVIGNGVVVDPGVLVKEMAMLEAEGISCKNLKISNDAHLIMPYHKDLDGADEKSLGDKKIGTTKRGIGPCYQDKMGRKGIRMQDLLDEKIFRLKLEAALAQKNPILEKIYGLHTYTVEEICDEYLPYARILAPYVCESAHMLNEALGDGKSILFEGAQGTLLDIDHGTYPFVTSSSCCAGGASTGTGVGPKAIDRVLGIQKAYVTRVGEGPFPTELKFPENGGTGQDAEDGELLCAAGHEFGVTTGRKRRCGWFDGAALRRAVEINGLTGLAVMKLDVLDECDVVRLGVGYKKDGVELEVMPYGAEEVAGCEVIYEDFPGWKTSTYGIKEWDKLPAAARSYLKRLSEVAGCPIAAVSTGPDREQTILLSDPFEA